MSTSDCYLKHACGHSKHLWFINKFCLKGVESIFQCDTREQLRNVQQLRVVRYRYAPEFSLHAGLTVDPNLTSDTGVIAQDVQRVLPEAVHAAGDIILPNGRRIDNFLVVNKVCTSLLLPQ